MTVPVSSIPPTLAAHLLDGGFPAASGTRTEEAAGTVESADTGQRRKLSKACQDFESLLLAQLVKGMRKSASELGPDGEEMGGGLMTEIMDDHLAQVLARGGGIGLAQVLERRISGARMSSGETVEWSHERPGGPARRVRPSADEPTGTSLADRLTRYEGMIGRAAEIFGVNADLIRAVVTQESSAHPDAVSPKGAKGLMQLMDETAQDLGVEDPFDAEENIRGGAQYLRQLLDRWSGDLTKALAAYNAGPAAVEQYDGVPPYRETQEYVRRVLGLLASPEGPGDSATSGRD